MMKNKNGIVVSVICLTYNHSAFIKQCLDGFLMQQTQFKFEVIIHDDASTDNTQNIITEYVKKHPDAIFVPILQKENQFSQNVRIGKTFIYPRCRGKYIAYCEGDDYWTDPHKLQRQVDFLEKNLEYVAIAENGLVQNSINNTNYPFNTAPSHDVCMEEAILKRRFPTAGVVFRKNAIKGFYETCKYSIDTIQWCWLISKGRLRYENTISSIYRKGEQGITVYTDPFIFLEKVEAWNLEILRVFDVKESFIYNHIVNACLVEARLSLRRLAIWSAVKCILYSFNYAVKTLQKSLLR